MENNTDNKVISLENEIAPILAENHPVFDVIIDEKSNKFVTGINEEASFIITKLVKKINELEDYKKLLVNKIKKECLDNGLEGGTSIKGNGCYITLKNSSKRTSFDEKKFKEDCPAIYEKYLKETEVSGSVSLNLEKKKKENEVKITKVNSYLED